MPRTSPSTTTSAPGGLVVIIKYTGPGSAGLIGGFCGTGGSILFVTGFGSGGGTTGFACSWNSKK